MRLRSPLVLAVLAALLSTLLVQAPANAAMRPAKFERIVENRLPGASMQHSAKARCMDRVIGNRMRGVRPAHLRNRCHVGVVRIVKVKRKAGPVKMRRIVLRKGGPAFRRLLRQRPTHLAVRAKRRGGAWVTVAAVARPDQGLSRVERGIINHTNDFRTNRGRSALRTDTCLVRNAQRHARVLADQGRLVHQDLRDVRADCGLRHGAVGENILYNGRGTAARAVRQWINSDGHRATMLRRQFDSIGVGQHYDRRTGRYYAVQVFGP